MWHVADISNYQPGPAADIIAANDAVWCQIGVPWFAEHVAEAARQGKPAGAYCWCFPNRSVHDELARYASLLAPFESQLQLRTALDVETTPGLPNPDPSQVAAWLSLWFAERPGDLIYTSPGEWSVMTGSSRLFGNVDLWVAGYGVTVPRLPAGWATWAAWQYTSTPYDRSLADPQRVLRAPQSPPGGDADMPNGWMIEDPQTKTGSWLLTPHGAVYASDGAPYLGGLNNHPDWNVPTLINPICGFSPWWDGTGWGYKIAVQTAGSPPANFYRFPRSGILAT